MSCVKCKLEIARLKMMLKQERITHVVRGTYKDKVARSLAADVARLQAKVAVLENDLVLADAKLKALGVEVEAQSK